MSFDWQFSQGDLPTRDEDPVPPPSPLSAGEDYGGYRILGPLGKGGMASVYRAVDAAGREVALKVLARLEPTAIQRFQREGQVVANLRHPGIVPVLHMETDASGRPFLVYELVEEVGPTFAQALVSGPLAPRLDLVEGVAEALACAHSQGVVHRDLKPANVLLDAEGDPRITDFGLATAAGLERLTQSGAMVGTPSWMAPEQVSSSSERHEPPTDVWALGVLLYQALCGELPFQGQHLHELAAAITLARPLSPRRRNRRISPELEQVCLRCLKRDPTQRYEDAERFLHALRAARRLTSKRARSRWGATAATALVLVTALGGAALGRLTRAPAPGATPSANSADETDAKLAARFAAIKELIDSRALDAASPRVDRFLREAPQAWRSWALLGELHTARQRYSDAEVAFRKAIALDEQVSLRIDLALVLHLMGDQEGAEREVSRALELDPQSARAFGARGMICYELGDLAGAAAAADQVLELDPQSPHGLNLRGLTRLAQGRPREALEDLERALAVDPAAATLANLALAHFDLGEPERALEFLEGSLREDPDQAQPYNTLAVIHVQAGRFQLALEAIDRCLAIDPRLPQAHLHRAVALARLGRYADARLSAERTLVLAPKGSPDRAHAREFLRQLERRGANAKPRFAPPR